MSVPGKLTDVRNIKLAIKASLANKGRNMTGKTFTDYPSEIDAIQVGTDISDADATPAEVLVSKTFYATSGGRKTGTMTDNGTVNTDISAKATEVTIAAGKHSGSGKVKISNTEQDKIIASNILKDITILGITGTVEAAVMGYTVRFIDYDGTILKTQIVASGQNATAPADPSHSLLTFQGWNRTYTNVTSNIDVGAIFNATTGHTYCFITLTAVTGTSPVIYLNKSNTAVLNIYDDNTNTLLGTSSASGYINVTLALVAIGDYRLRIECSGGYSFGNQSASNAIFKDGAYTNILTKILIGNSVTSIDIFAFYGCYSLALVNIPTSVTSIGTYAFYNCYSLASITIPTSVTSVGTYTWCNCYSVRIVTIPTSVTTIGTYVFANCYSLTSIVIHSSVTSLGNYIFYGCKSLLYIVIPSSVTSIGTYAFYNCYALASVTIPSSVTSIGTYTFAYCSSMISIILPSSVTSIGTYAFYNCYALASVTIPSSVTSIGASAFFGCCCLTSIVIPSSVTSIGASAFYNCFALISYVVNRATPPTIANTDAFTGINSICLIKVPSASVAAYKAATNLITYANYIVSQ